MKELIEVARCDARERVDHVDSDGRLGHSLGVLRPEDGYRATHVHKRGELTALERGYGRVVHYLLGLDLIGNVSLVRSASLQKTSALEKTQHR